MDLSLKSLREPRLGGFVLFDTIASLLGAVVISKVFNINLAFLILILFVMSIALHYMLGIDTRTNYLFGLSNDPSVTTSAMTQPEKEEEVVEAEQPPMYEDIKEPVIVKTDTKKEMTEVYPEQWLEQEE